MLSRTAPALAVALFALSACASQGGSAVPAVPQASDPGAVPSVGGLHVEPSEIIYSRRRGQGDEQAVRVWQNGYHGEYAARNRCSGVTLTLRKYTIHNASIWNLNAKNAQVQSCEIVFTGSGGPRGTNYLHISILR